MPDLPERDPELEEGDEAFELKPTNKWGLAVIGLSLVARVTEDAAEMVQDVAKFWCELAMAAAGQSNHELHKKEFAEQAALEIETLTSGAYDASTGEASGG
jgi:hypothetical protein